MSEEKMKNPYELHGAHPDVVRVGRKAGVGFVVVFLLLIVLPPLGRNVYEAVRPLENPDEKRWFPILEFFNYPSQKDEETLALKRKFSSRIERTKPSLRDHLQTFEKELEKGDYVKATTGAIQARMLKLGEGNRTAYMGEDGWLYLQTGLDGLLRYGPLKPEPDSVTKDPDRAEWEQPLPVILNFAEQLKARGVDLLLVPVPVKPMIVSEGITGKEPAGPVWHPDQEKLYEELRGGGVEVLDLTRLFWDRREGGKPVFLKQDTHWTYETMKAAVATVAENVKARPWYGEIEPTLEVSHTNETREHLGDLVGMLGLKHPEKHFEPETQEVELLREVDSGEVIARDENSPVVLLGDSFVNVYHDASIGFGKPRPKDDKSPPEQIGAGFASQLATSLGIRLDVHSNNGEGATGVREQFAREYEDQVRAKKLVIWVIASRDLLLSETPGANAKVRWREVTFNTQKKPEEKMTSAPAGGAVAVVEVTDRSPVGDPTSTPYPSVIYTAILKVDNVEKGAENLKVDEIRAYLWGFKDRKLEPTANLQKGKKYRLTVVPWSSKPELSSIRLNDDFTTNFSEEWFVESMEEVE